MKRTIELTVWFGLLLPLVFGQTTKSQVLSAAEAKQHVGESATVCGKVVAARISKYSVGRRGKPITFDLDETAPKRVFMFISWSPDPKTVEQTRDSYTGKNVCVSGTITRTGATPHMVVSDSSQIQVQTEGKN
jgi:hypothetical protein